MINIEELRTMRIPINYEIDKTFDDSRFIKMRLRIQHDQVNPNQSEFDLEDIKRAAPSLANTPILANVIWDEDGNAQFGGHDIILEKSKINGEEYREIYVESPIGIIPANDIGYEIKEYKGKNHVYANAYIWRKISNYAEDLILRDNDINLSMEIDINEFAYNPSTKIYKVKDYKYTGITFLNSGLGTGMEHALATTKLDGDFSLNNNKERFLFICNELQNALQNYDLSNNEINKDNKFIKNEQQEGGNKLDEKLELLKQFNLDIKDLDFKIDDLSIEDFTLKLKEFNKKQAEIKFSLSNTFATTYRQKKEAIENALSPIYESNGNGEVISETNFDLHDFDDEHVFVEKTRYTNGDYTEEFGRMPYNFSQTTFKANITGEFERMIKTYMTVDDFNQQQNNMSYLKYSEDDIQKIKDEFENYKAEYTTKDSDVKEFEALKEYKAQKELEEFNEAKESLFSQFEDLKDIKEFETLKSNTEFTLDDIEKELFYIRGKKNTTNFTAIKKKTKEEPKSQFTKIPIMESEVTNMNKENFDDIYNKYNK